MHADTDRCAEQQIGQGGALTVNRSLPITRCQAAVRRGEHPATRVQGKLVKITNSRPSDKSIRHLIICQDPASHLKIPSTGIPEAAQAWALVFGRWRNRRRSEAYVHLHDLPRNGHKRQSTQNALGRWAIWGGNTT
jgi:hypothetical protein